MSSIFIWRCWRVCSAACLPAFLHSTTLIKRLFCTVIILCPIFCGLCGTQSQLRLRQKGIVILKQIDRFITLIPPKMKSFQRIFSALNAFQFVSFTTQLLTFFLSFSVQYCKTYVFIFKVQLNISKKACS